MKSDIDRAASDFGAFAATSTDSANRGAAVARFATAGMRDIADVSFELTKLAAASTAVKASVAARTLQLRRAARLAAEAYPETVWASGFQAQLDACRGAVNLTAAYGVRVIGEKWGCGGARFPHEGATVRLSGVVSGLYRVGPVVAVLNAYTQTTRDIPRGYALLYQTCRNNNAHTETFTELIPIG